MISRDPNENMAQLEKLEVAHVQFKDSLGAYNKSRKWAVWQLQGASLAIAFRAIKFQEEKDLITLDIYTRLSMEVLNSVSYFANPNTTSEAIKSWMKVYGGGMTSNLLEDIGYTLFKPKKTKRGEKKLRFQHERYRTLPEGIDFSLGDYSEALNTLLSVNSHPSYDLVRKMFETDKNNGSYNLYNYKRLVHDYESVNVLASMMVYSAACTIHLGSYLFGNVLSVEELYT